MARLAFNIGSELWVKESIGVDPSGTFTLGQLVSALLPNLYLAAGVILFFLLLFAGLQFIMGAGEDDPEKTAKAKKAITAAVIGFLLIFGSYWLIQIIEVITGVGIFEPGGLP